MIIPFTPFLACIYSLPRLIPLVVAYYYLSRLVLCARIWSRMFELRPFSLYQTIIDGWPTSPENSKFSLRPKLIIVFGTGDRHLLLHYRF